MIYKIHFTLFVVLAYGILSVFSNPSSESEVKLLIKQQDLIIKTMQAQINQALSRIQKISEENSFISSHLTKNQNDLQCSCEIPSKLQEDIENLKLIINNLDINTESLNKIQENEKSKSNSNILFYSEPATHKNAPLENRAEIDTLNTFKKPFSTPHSNSQSTNDQKNIQSSSFVEQGNKQEQPQIEAVENQSGHNEHNKNKYIQMDFKNEPEDSAGIVSNKISKKPSVTPQTTLHASENTSNKNTKNKYTNNIDNIDNFDNSKNIEQNTPQNNNQNKYELEEAYSIFHSLAFSTKITSQSKEIIKKLFNTFENSDKKADTNKKAYLLTELSIIYANENLFEQAEQHCLQALELLKSMGADYNPIHILAHATMGNIYHNLEKYKLAIDHYLLSLQASDATNKTNTIQCVHVMESLGTVYIISQEFEAALDVFIKAFEIKKNLFGLTDLGVIESLERIAATWGLLKNYEQAYQYYEWIAQHVENNFSSKHTYLVNIYYKLSHTANILNRKNDAIQFIKKSIDLAKNNDSGYHHPDIDLVMNFEKTLIN